MNQVIGPGQRDRDGQVSHSRRANASASPKAGLRGRSLTTLGALNGDATVAMNRAQAEGLSVRTTAATKISDGVTSGKLTTSTSPFLESEEDQVNVLTKSRHGCASFTGLLQDWLKSGKPI